MKGRVKKPSLIRVKVCSGEMSSYSVTTRSDTMVGDEESFLGFECAGLAKYVFLVFSYRVLEFQFRPVKCTVVTRFNKNMEQLSIFF